MAQHQNNLEICWDEAKTRDTHWGLPVHAAEKPAALGESLCSSGLISVTLAHRWSYFEPVGILCVHTGGSQHFYLPQCTLAVVYTCCSRPTIHDCTGSTLQSPQRGVCEVDPRLIKLLTTSHLLHTYVDPRQRI